MGDKAVEDEQAGWSVPALPDESLKGDGDGDAGAPETSTMSFEGALEELEGIVQELERGQLDLEEAIRAYERGTALKLHCEQKLKAAQLRVERIAMSDGAPRAVPFDER